MTPRWRAAVLLGGASVLISITAVRATRAERTEAAAPASVAVEAQAGNYVGMSSCTSSQCHTAVGNWAKTLDGSGKKQHFNAANQLSPRAYPVVTEYVKAVGGNPSADANPTCLGCHSTPLPGDDYEGVTCEKCHGAGKRYREPHSATKGAGVAPYIALGMIDRKTPKNWVKLCVDCHVLDPQKYRALVGTTHPDGSKFDVTKAFLVVQGPPNTHWATRKYTSADVAPFVPAKPAAANPITPPAPPPSPTPTPVVATPSPSPVTTPNVGPLTPSPKPSPTPGTGTGARTTPAPPPVVVVPPPPPPPPPPVVKTPVVTPRPDPPPPGPRPTAEVLPVTPPAPPVGTPPAEAPTLSGLIASVQGRLINVLSSLLRQNATVPQRVVPPAKPAVYSGPDWELLKLQDDIISLALEVLGKAPGKGGGSQ